MHARVLSWFLPRQFFRWYKSNAYAISITRLSHSLARPFASDVRTAAAVSGGVSGGPRFAKERTSCGVMLGTNLVDIPQGLISRDLRSPTSTGTVMAASTNVRVEATGSRILPTLPVFRLFQQILLTFSRYGYPFTLRNVQCTACKRPTTVATPVAY